MMNWGPGNRQLTMNSSRTVFGDIPNLFASPEHTPAITRFCGRTRSPIATPSDSVACLDSSMPRGCLEDDLETVVRGTSRRFSQALVEPTAQQLHGEPVHPTTCVRRDRTGRDVRRWWAGRAHRAAAWSWG